MSAAGSSYRELRPPKALAAHVACLWTSSTGDCATALRRRVVPDGCIDIVWLGDVEASIAGPATRSFIPELRARATIVGVRFLSGAAPSVLGVPAHALLNTDLPLREIWGRAALQLSER